MAVEVPGEDSSSLNGKFTISQIHKPRRHKYRIDFLEGETIFIHEKIFLNNNLHAGLELSQQKIELLKQQSLFMETEQKALKLISKTLHSAYTLKIKLLKRGYTEEMINPVLEKLQARGLVNDCEFAKAWVLSRMEIHPESGRMLAAGLKKRGIAGEVAAQVIAGLVTREKELECAKKLISRKTLKESPDCEKLSKLLLARGFSYKIIHEILEEM